VLEVREICQAIGITLEEFVKKLEKALKWLHPLRPRGERRARRRLTLSLTNYSLMC
jgi:hypothetical protein